MFKNYALPSLCYTVGGGGQVKRSVVNMNAIE